MKILALDSSGMTASVAVVDERKMLGEYTINHKKTHSQTLLPMLDEVVRMIELNLDEIDAIAIAAGPGSFTGLRIGSATAKGLAQGLNKPIIEVPTLEAMAYQFCTGDEIICPMMDARRNQVFTGIYKWDEGNFVVVEDQMVIDITEIVDKVNHYNNKTVYLGDGSIVFENIISENSKVPFKIAPPHLLCQRASAVAVRAIQYFKEGKYVEASKHKPVYLRLSQAERERMEREKIGK